MGTPDYFKPLPLGSNDKIGMLIPETLTGVPVDRIAGLSDQEVRFDRNSFVTLREKVSKIKLSKVLASIMDYLLEFDPPRVLPRIAQMEVTPDDARLLIASTPAAPSFLNYVLCAEYELAMALRGMAADYAFTDAEVEVLAYQLAKKCPEAPRLIQPFDLGANPARRG